MGPDIAVAHRTKTVMLLPPAPGDGPWSFLPEADAPTEGGCMSVRSLPSCLVPAALLAAAILTDILAPRPRLVAGDGPTCPACKECLNQACTAKSACAEK